MIDVVMTTYQPTGSQRAKYMKLTVESLVQNLKGDEFRLIIADDGSPDQDTNFAMCRYVENHGWANPIITNALRAGVGGSMNLALNHVDGLWIYTVDDWMLGRELNIEKARALLEWHDCVRIGAIHPNITCYARFNERLGWWLELDQARGGFVFATRPFLATKQFYEKVGPFKDKCSSYDVETDYAMRINSSDVRIAHVGTLEGPFIHIGENVNSIGAKWP